MYVNDRASHDYSFAVGLLCGTAIGAAIGLLLAPRSGADLRHQIAGSADRWRRTMNEKYTRAGEMVERVVDDGREAMRRGREAFNRKRTDAEPEHIGS